MDYSSLQEEKVWPVHASSSSGLLIIIDVTFPKKWDYSQPPLCLMESESDSSSLSYPQSPHKDAVTVK